jgi:hypothetical protein
MKNSYKALIEDVGGYEKENLLCADVLSAVSFVYCFDQNTPNRPFSSLKHTTVLTDCLVLVKAHGWNLKVFVLLKLCILYFSVGICE